MRYLDSQRGKSIRMGAQTIAPSSKTPSLNARRRTLTRQNPLPKYLLKMLESLGIKPLKEISDCSDEVESGFFESDTNNELVGYCTQRNLQVDSIECHGGGMGIFVGLTAGGRSSADLSNSAASAAMSEEYALQSGKSYGKHGNPL